MKGKRNICVFSGTRAEYGLLNPLMRAIREDDSLNLGIMVSGAHLSPEFGLTYQYIESDGFHIDEKIEMLVSSDTSSGICKSMGLGLIQFSDAIKRLNPDIIVLLGDRYEAFSVAVAALVNNIPIAHIHGGESSYGSIDESFRHAITKMSNLHFTCAEQYHDRVVQLGEHPDRVFDVGSLGVENIQTISLLPKEKFYKQMGFDIKDSFFLVTYHPVTLELSKTAEHFEDILKALSMSEFEKNKIIFTKANADSAGRRINKRIDEFVCENKTRAISFDSMGQLRYLSAMQYCSLVIGNSSSGILEAPSFKVPVINVGNRQKGRLKSDNIIDCKPMKNQIIQAMQRGLSNSFIDSLGNMKSPFEKASTANQIKNIIKSIDLSDLTLKEFCDYV